MEKTTEELQEENRRLREALQEYGEHKRDCEIWMGAHTRPPYYCSCGYEELIGRN